MPILAPYLAVATVLLMPACLLAMKKYWYADLIRTKPWTRGSLIALVAAGFAVRLVLLEPNHVMYTDEFMYMKAAKELILGSDISWYLKSWGWPALLAVSFALFGIDNLVAIYTNAFLSALAPLGIFLLAKRTYRDERIAVTAAFIFSCIPGFLYWSMTAETNTLSLSFITLAVYAAFLYYEHRTTALAWISACCLAMLAQLRPENYVFYLVFVAGFFLFVERPSEAFRAAVVPLSVSLLATVANLKNITHFYLRGNWLLHESEGAIIGDNFSVANLIHNSAVWGMRLAGRSLHPMLFSILFAVGIVYTLRRSPRHACYFLVWLALVYVVYFSAWFQTIGHSQELGAKIRLYIAFYPVMTVVAASGIGAVMRIRAIGVTLALVCTLATAAAWIYPVSEKFYLHDPLKKLQTAVLPALETALEPADILVTHFPEIVTATTDLRAISTGDFTAAFGPRTRFPAAKTRIFFFEDYTSSTPWLKQRTQDLIAAYPHRLYRTWRCPRPCDACAINLYQLFPDDGPAAEEPAQ